MQEILLDWKKVINYLTIKDIIYIFRLKKEVGDTAAIEIRIFLDWKKKMKHLKVE